VEELGYAAGGENAAGEASRHAHHERDLRLGSGKQVLSGQP